MSTINVDKISPYTPFPNTGVTINGATINGTGTNIGMRSLNIGNNQYALKPGTGQSADQVHLGVSIFSSTTGYTISPQTIAIGSLICDLTTQASVSQSVFIGTEIARNITTGDNNVLIGYQSGTSLSGNSNSNVMIGTQSGSQVTSGGANILIGSGAGNNVTTGGNNIIIGGGSSNISPSTNNAITLGNSFHNVLRCAVTTITSLSDKRDKKEIEPLNVGLEFINTLKPVTFVWDERSENGKHDIKDFGFIAQDLKTAQEDINLEDTLRLVYEENPDKLEASYGKLVPILVKAIQDLSKEIENLKNKLN